MGTRRGAHLGRSRDPLPIRVKLAALFLGTAAARFLAGLFAVKQPQFFIDELVYWSFARAFHEGAPLTLYGRALDHPVYTYPLLLSPAFALESSIATFVAIQALNALMQATVVFFAFFFARELVDERTALLAALVSALLPTGVLTSVLMAENAFLPLATLASWLLYRTLRDARPRDGALAAAVLAVATFTKPHAVMLLAGYGAAVLVGWFRSRNARPLAAQAIPFASLVLVACVRFLVAPESEGLAALFGGSHYGRELRSTGLDAFGWMSALGFGHVAVLAIAVGFFPLAALLVAALSRNVPDRLVPLARFTLGTLLALLVLSVTHVVTVDLTSRLYERYFAVLAPALVTIALALPERLRRRTLGAALTLGLASGVGLAITAKTVLTWHVHGDAPGLTGFFRLFRSTGSVATGLAIAAAAVLATFAFAFLGKRFGVVLLATYFLVLNGAWYREVREIRNDTRARRFVLEVERLARGAPVFVVVDGLDRTTLWALELWTRTRPVACFVERPRPEWWLPLAGPLDEVVADSREA